MSSAKPPFVLVFDVDGTLIDSRGHLNHSVVELLCLGIIAREYGIVSAILILTNNVFQQTNANGTKGHVMEWLTTTLVRRIIDYIVNHRYIEYRYRITQSKIFELASQ
jgi:phosphoglycolate phosphatase-like HAD superfamily hydrolase